MTLPAQIARAQRRHVEARDERDALIRRAIEEGFSRYRLAREMRKADPDGPSLSESSIRAISKNANGRESLE